MKRIAAALCALVFSCAAAAQQEADHEIHEALRNLLKEVVTAINTGQYDRMLPYLTENVEATSITQETMSSRADISRYFKEWFELSPDKSWGLVRGKALEQYEANDGDVFDFTTRWTAVMVRGDDGQWRLRAIHFGTNNLDNPVLKKVKNTLIRDGIIGAVAALAIGIGIGYFVARRRRAMA